jgi:hypothetical protein
MHTKPVRPAALSLAVAAAVLSTSLVPAQRTIGMIADRTDHVVVFDADNDHVIGAVPIPGDPGLPLFDCEIAAGVGLGFVSDFDNQRIWVVDLWATPPGLANGGQPIAITTYPLDLTLTPDERFLLAADGNGPGEPLSIVDVALLQEIGTWSFGAAANPSSVHACPDGSVLVTELTSPTTTIVRRFAVDAAGDLTDTGESLPDVAAPDINNIVCTSFGQDVPGAKGVVAVYTSRRANQRLGSFAVDGLVPADVVAPSGPFGIDLAISHASTWVYVRTNATPDFGGSGPGAGFVDAFMLNPTTGRFGPTQFTIPLDRRTGTAFGVEQMAVDPEGRKLYISGLALPEIRIHHAKTGQRIGTLTAPGLGIPTGIAIARMR